MSAVTAPLRPRPRPSALRPPELRVVPRPRRRHTLAYLLAVIGVVAAGIFASLSLNALAAAAAVEARALDAQVVEAERRYAQLIADVAALEDPARIRAEALALGLEPAGPGRTLALDRNLPADGAVSGQVSSDVPADPLKPLLTLEP